MRTIFWSILVIITLPAVSQAQYYDASQHRPSPQFSTYPHSPGGNNSGSIWDIPGNPVSRSTLELIEELNRKNGEIYDQSESLISDIERNNANSGSGGALSVGEPELTQLMGIILMMVVAVFLGRAIATTKRQSER